MPVFYFVVNPIAGAGQCKEKSNEVKKLLDEHGVEYDYEYSNYIGEAREIAKRAAEEGNYKTIVSVGGDGTIQEVAQGIYGTGKTLGIFPFGTGNDMARSLRIPLDIKGCVDALINGTTQNMDVVFADERMFMNVGGFGFDSDVLINTQEYKKRYTGMFPYFLGILKTMMHLKTMHLKITADDREVECDSLLIAVANGTDYGGGMKVSPYSDPFDGYFDVCIVKKINILTFISLLPSFLKGKHIGKKPVIYFKAKHLSVESTGDYQLNLDGELYPNLPSRFDIVEGAMPVVVPVGANNG